MSGRKTELQISTSNVGKLYFLMKTLFPNFRSLKIKFFSFLVISKIDLQVILMLSFFTSRNCNFSSNLQASVFSLAHKSPNFL